MSLRLFWCPHQSDSLSRLHLLLPDFPFRTGSGTAHTEAGIHFRYNSSALPGDAGWKIWMHHMCFRFLLPCVYLFPEQSSVLPALVYLLSFWPVPLVRFPSLPVLFPLRQTNRTLEVWGKRSQPVLCLSHSQGLPDTLLMLQKIR